MKMIQLRPRNFFVCSSILVALSAACTQAYAGTFTVGDLYDFEGYTAGDSISTADDPISVINSGTTLSIAQPGGVGTNKLLDFTTNTNFRGFETAVAPGSGLSQATISFDVDSVALASTNNRLDIALFDGDGVETAGFQLRRNSTTSLRFSIFGDGASQNDFVTYANFDGLSLSIDWNNTTDKFIVSGSYNSTIPSESDTFSNVEFDFLAPSTSDFSYVEYTLSAANDSAGIDNLQVIPEPNQAALAMGVSLLVFLMARRKRS